MNNSTLNFSASETSTNSTDLSIGLMESLEICVFSIYLLFGLPTNSYVIWLIVTGTSGVALEFLNLNLSVCEIGNCVNCLISILSIWFLSILPFNYFLIGLVATGRPLFQCLMCVERYLAVVHPVTFLKYKPLRYRVICCAVAWMITFGSCFCCMFTMGSYLIVHIWLTLMQSLFVFSIQLFCLVDVLRALKQSGPGEKKRVKEENHMKRRAFYLILVTTVSMVIIYVPFSISGIYTVLIKEFLWACWIPSMICYVLAGFVQPILYLHRTGKLF
ncbi:C-C chemokine receptor type 8-like [Danio aesculapii]|uniref:C-C chemokine receptor type 8-like n=1 Tax=Danio aesculapii TaxID=1142201 RepID=UPI0024BFB800|nr:C-C chemokine receptor type 8-like [Danio aesculapii]